MLSIRKYSEVEVSLEDEEFKDSYYRAILEDNPIISGHKNLRVRYLTLLKKDSSALRTEIVDHNLIRPVPPDDLNDGVVFEEGLVVDAYIRGGWWTGVVEETMEDDKFLVYFNNPPETIQFEKNELRVHLDWINFKWVRHDKTELIKSDFSSGTLVEVRLEFAWLPGIVIEELEDEKFIVKYKHGKSNITAVDLVRLRPMQPSFPVEKYEVLDRVEAFCGLAWCQGVVRKMIYEGRYMVSFDATDEASQFNHSDLRPSMEWVNEVWHDKGPMPKSRKGSNGKRKKPSKPKKRKKPVALITGNDPMKKHAHEQGNEMIDDVVNEKESGSPITMEITQGNICPEPMKNHNGLGDESTREKMLDEHTQKRKRGELEHSSDTNETFLSSDRTLNVVKNVAANVEETQAKDLDMVLPFAKKSQFWKTYESMEVFKRVPQTPHFNPLCETKEDFREGYALGMMVTYSVLWERLKDLETNVPVSQLDSLRDSFAELEKHGFDVTLPLSQIEKLLALKDGLLHIVEELNVLDKEMMDETSKKHKAEEELGEIDQNILEVKQKILMLQKQEVALEKRKEAAEEQKDAAYKKICHMESCARDLGVQLEDVEFEFQTTLSAPW